MSKSRTRPAAKRAPSERRDRARTELETAHATVRLEYGPAGVIARIERGGVAHTEYAGPLPEPTIDALCRVASGGAGR